MRIIAGELKGRRLRAPSWTGMRPTSDRLRETLFALLDDRVTGATVLDGCAGTGAVGLEAISRGATAVTFIDSDRRAAALIRANLADLRRQFPGTGGPGTAAGSARTHRRAVCLRSGAARPAVRI